MVEVVVGTIPGTPDYLIDKRKAARISPSGFFICEMNDDQ
jgi:hypothetical protein